MDLKELNDLITIREYTVNSTSNPNIDKKTIRQLDGILLLLDIKIVEMITSNDFKEYIGFNNLPETIKEMRLEKDKHLIKARNIMKGERIGS